MKQQQQQQKPCWTEKAIPQDILCVNGLGFVIICTLAEKYFISIQYLQTHMSVICTPPDPTVTTRALISICAAPLQAAII